MSTRRTTRGRAANLAAEEASNPQVRLDRERREAYEDMLPRCLPTTGRRYYVQMCRRKLPKWTCKKCKVAFEKDAMVLGTSATKTIRRYYNDDNAWSKQVASKNWYHKDCFAMSAALKRELRKTASDWDGFSELSDSHKKSLLLLQAEDDDDVDEMLSLSTAAEMARNDARETLNLTDEFEGSRKKQKLAGDGKRLLVSLNPSNKNQLHIKGDTKEAKDDIRKAGGVWASILGIWLVNGPDFSSIRDFLHIGADTPLPVDEIEVPYSVLYG
eukprot:TRINITY_DN3579_c0_g2_i2.p1 TRINITY_DN3579_c0_g2~~TRINITY_DN3579_c0_g2_i2.p1  ORF type:complete len:271 (+),score=54.17 TRINITY_DN3579_c0_g2_i2:150-962(+)